MGALLLFSLLLTAPVTGLLAGERSGQTAPPAAAQPQPAGEEVHFQNGDLALAGLWCAPPGNGPFAAVVIIPGSGPSQRDNAWARSFVELFLSAGAAVLLPDKRGADGSAGDWRQADFDALAGDALAAVAYVRSRPDVLAGMVGLAGLSQGGKIAPLAAAQSDDVAFVMNFVGSATPLVEQISWEMFHTFREAGLEGAELQDALALQVLAEKYVSGESGWDAYEAALAEALTGPWAEVARGFPSTPDAWQWTFFRGIGEFDPLPHWREVRQPVLVVYGENDPNAPSVRSAYRLIRVFTDNGHPDWTLRIIAGAGHALRAAESADGKPPGLHPELVSLVRGWLAERTDSN